jgi:hypothetical protein
MKVEKIKPKAKKHPEATSGCTLKPKSKLALCMQS